MFEEFDLANPMESCSIKEHDNQPRGEADNTASIMARPLVNGRSPAYVLKAEKPEHRFICFLLAQGFTAKEISDEHGYTTAMIGYVAKQDWAKEFIVQAMAEVGGQGIVATLKEHAIKAALDMDELRLRAKAANQLETERKICKDIMDRYYGQSAQLVQHVTVDPNTLSDAELSKMVSDSKAN